MKSKHEIELKVKQMKEELDTLFVKRDNSTKNWEFQEYCLLICNLAKEINLLEWVLNDKH